LYEALKFDIPKLVTVPPILGSNGGKKLSKRDGAKDVLDYAKDGILPEALLNYLASLGWNDGTEQEIFTINELVSKFSLDVFCQYKQQYVTINTIIVVYMPYLISHAHH